ncbi:hypothetical protein SERLA73DRAFT_148925 [Serpula lacrymans var. lacrymans S7.3]|uniref:Uncharacterized protein n=1 Tax=Serpula lacrymans var. lacrymans (strain S7.3) TaxID=936435 RepID=F8PGV9_SERL3|nr:hypothetical protein SERLA73DRAFT_148925 [Serpula lacrymans var. lacrymans S7.3]
MQDFSPADIWATNWQKIALVEGSSGPESSNREDEWKSVSVKILVPFHNKMDMLGPQDFVVANFHYHKILLIVHEQLSDPQDGPQYHFSPYALWWQPNHQEESHIYGELFTGLIQGLCEQSYWEKEYKRKFYDPLPLLPREASFFSLLFWVPFIGNMVYFS